MAADSQDTRESGLIVSVSSAKLQRAPNGDIFACQGDEDHCVEFEDWYKGGCDPEETPDFDSDSAFEALVLTHDGSVVKYTNRLTVVTVNGPYIALGAGDEVAMGAMAAGASPERAVEIACQLNAYTGGPVVSMSIGGE